MTTIPQRLREIARSVHEMEYGQPNALADSLHAIAAELEAPAADAVKVVAYAGFDGWAGKSVAILVDGYEPLESENLIRQRDHLATVAALQARINALEARQVPLKRPCGECHLQPGERCDICGAQQEGAQPQPDTSKDQP